MHRHDMYALALQFPAKGFAELRQTTFDSGVGRIEWRRNKRNAGRDVDKLFGSLCRDIWPPTGHPYRR